MSRKKKKYKRVMKINTYAGIIGLLFLAFISAEIIFFLQFRQIYRQNAAGPITYGGCTGPAPANTQGVCYAQPNDCTSQGLTQYYTSTVPASESICAQNALKANVANGSTVYCCPANSSYTHTYGTCGSTNQDTCTTDTCVGTPIFTDTVPTACSDSGYSAGLTTGTNMYCCSVPPTPTATPTPSPTPAIVPCGNVCGINFACGSPITVAGKVTDSTGKGVKGLNIQIYDNNRHNNPSLYPRYTDTVSTDANGNFSETPLICGGLSTPGNYGDAYSVYPDWNTCIPGYSCNNPNPPPPAIGGQQANKPGVPDCAKTSSCNFTVTLVAKTTGQISFSLSGTGPGGNTNPNHKTRAYKLYFVTHQLTSSFLAEKVKGAQILTVNGTASFDKASGSFIDNNLSLGSIPLGQYDVILHVDSALDRRIYPSDGSQFFTIDASGRLVASPVALSVGDIAPAPVGDNAVDIQDYNSMLSCISGTICPNRPLADLNDDGIINDIDMQLLMNSFGSVGDSFNTQKFNCVTDPACSTVNKSLQMCQLLCSLKNTP